MMRGKSKKIVILMDEIDGMNNGDKGGINALIKLIRQKKTKKQKMEHVTLIPIICIGNYYVDKKIKELMKVCHIFELKPLSPAKIGAIIPFLGGMTPLIQTKILEYIQGDMRKLNFVLNMHEKHPQFFEEDVICGIFQTKSFHEDAKKITASLLHTDFSIEKHNQIMNDTDRTIVALLWHENIADILDNIPAPVAYTFYSTILDNMCFADYIDRITFQNQIWLFNEMSSLIKTFYNNHLFHQMITENTSATSKSKPKANPNDEIRFTKVLTKYSTEYNNSLFLYTMSQELNMDKKDLSAFFQELRIRHSLAEIEDMFGDYTITKLDIRRMYRFLDKNVKKEDMESSIEEMAFDEK
jgi:hypothetical protein